MKAEASAMANNLSTAKSNTLIVDNKTLPMPFNSPRNLG
jgi:hypothetical protein